MVAINAFLSALGTQMSASLSVNLSVCNAQSSRGTGPQYYRFQDIGPYWWVISWYLVGTGNLMSHIRLYLFCNGNFDVSYKMYQSLNGEH